MIFTEHSMLDVWHGSQYASGFLKLFCRGSQRDTTDCLTCAKLVITFTPNSRVFPLFRSSPRN